MANLKLILQLSFSLVSHGEAIGQMPGPLSCTEFDANLGHRLRPACEFIDPAGARSRINSLGMIEKEPIEAFRNKPRSSRVLFLGSSLLAGLGLPIDQGPLRVLEKKINAKLENTSVEIINAAVPGYYPVHHAINLRAILRSYNPGTVVLHLGNGLNALDNLVWDNRIRCKPDGAPESIDFSPLASWGIQGHFPGWPTLYILHREILRFRAKRLVQNIMRAEAPHQTRENNQDKSITLASILLEPVVAIADWMRRESETQGARFAILWTGEDLTSSYRGQMGLGSIFPRILEMITGSIQVPAESVREYLNRSWKGELVVAEPPGKFKQEPENFLPDRIHYSSLGAERVAESIADKIIKDGSGGISLVVEHVGLKANAEPERRSSFCDMPK